MWIGATKTEWHGVNFNNMACLRFCGNQMIHRCFKHIYDKLSFFLSNMTNYLRKYSPTMSLKKEKSSFATKKNNKNLKSFMRF